MKYRNLLLLIALAMWCLVGCSSSVPTATITPSTTSPSETLTTAELEVTFTPLPTVTPSPEVTLMPTHTAIVTSTLLPTETSTPLPTLSPEEAEMRVLDLFHSNRGCQLPCLWGFTPGQTDWQTTEQFLARFVTRIEIVSMQEEPVFSAYVYLPVARETTPTPLRYIYGVRNGIIEMIEGQVLHTPTYRTSAILNTYGPPGEVWLSTANQPIEGFLGFVMILFYPQHGFMLRYGGQGIVQDDQVQSCLEDPILLLAIWPPEEELTYAKAASKTVQFGPTTYHRPLEEATGMSIETFYEAFRDPGNPICLKTPTNLWPAP